ncbi:MAG: hypoxanthine/guanine phosphoribosyltransferase [Methanobacteriota archaeon]
MVDRLRSSLATTPIVKMGEYDYFVHPLTDGVPSIDPKMISEVVEGMRKVADPRFDRIVTAEAMGIPIGVLLSVATGKPLTILRKRSYQLPGEVALHQVTGYRKNELYVNGLSAGDRVLFVDDVISTGGTLGAVIEAFRKIGVDLVDIVVVFEKGRGAQRLRDQYGVTIKALLKVEVRNGKIVEIA